MNTAIRSTAVSLALCLCLCGCAGVREPANGPRARGSLAVRVISLLGMKGNELNARIYVDGRFVGTYEPDETVIPLVVGRHRVRLEVPGVHGLRTLPNGNTEDRAYTLSGEERVEILGGGAKQVLSFGDQNLRAREIRNPSGH